MAFVESPRSLHVTELRCTRQYCVQAFAHTNESQSPPTATRTGRVKNAGHFRPFLPRCPALLVIPHYLPCAVLEDASGVRSLSLPLHSGSSAGSRWEM